MFQKITKKSEDSNKWYEEVVEKAKLAEHSPVKGCMTIRPYGYALWENIQAILDREIKKMGVKNAYFPLFIPKSFIEKEKEHIEGFAPECVIATEGGGKKLEEPLVLRPTSETVIYATFPKWIRSYRDLPLKINQWANIIRWEKRPRLFLRTIEFLWQEGHTVHATEKEAEKMAREALSLYHDFARNYLAIETIQGQKSESEKFAGALRSYAIEGLMSDGKALQMGTSHNLGQEFAKVFGIKYLDKDNKEQLAWQTSWGVSTRLVGAIILAHGDDKGLILPPKIAPYQAVIVPIWRSSDEKKMLEEKIERLVGGLGKETRIKVEWQDNLTPGFKFNKWELKGAPLRIEIGPKDLEKNQVVFIRRDDEKKESIKWDQISNKLKTTLDDIQKNLLKKNQDFLQNNTHTVDSYDQFKKILEEKSGFIKAGWCGSEACEEKVKSETKATIRVIPFKQPKKLGKCICCGKPAKHEVIFAKAY